MVNIKDLSDKTPVKKEKTGLVREVMLNFTEQRISVKRLASLLGVAHSTCSCMCNPKSPVHMRLKHLRRFISHFPERSVTQFLLSIDSSISAEKLVGTYFKLQLPSECNIPPPALKKETSEDKREIIISSQRKKFISGIYHLFDYRESWEFYDGFEVEETEQFLEDGKVPASWVEKIREQTDFEKFVFKFQNQNKEKEKKKNENIPSDQLTQQKKGREAEDVRQLINNMPLDVFKAITSAFANAGIVKKNNLSLEVLLGTLIVKLPCRYSVVLEKDDRITIISEEKGKEVKISINGKFPWSS